MFLGSFTKFLQFPIVVGFVPLPCLSSLLQERQVFSMTELSSPLVWLPSAPQPSDLHTQNLNKKIHYSHFLVELGGAWWQRGAGSGA